jgi:hypothetical protein
MGVGYIKRRPLDINKIIWEVSAEENSRRYGSHNFVHVCLDQLDFRIDLCKCQICEMRVSRSVTVMNRNISLELPCTVKTEISSPANLHSLFISILNVTCIRFIITTLKVVDIDEKGDFDTCIECCIGDVFHIDINTIVECNAHTTFSITFVLWTQ